MTNKTMKNSPETFTETRDRLMEIHGWDRREATLAVRYYRNIDSYDEMVECLPIREYLYSADEITGAM